MRDDLAERGKLAAAAGVIEMRVRVDRGRDRLIGNRRGDVDQGSPVSRQLRVDEHDATVGRHHQRVAAAAAHQIEVVGDVQRLRAQRDRPAPHSAQRRRGHTAAIAMPDESSAVGDRAGVSHGAASEAHRISSSLRA